MDSILRPGDSVELAGMVEEAASGKRALRIAGGGSKLAFGRPVKAAHVLDLSRLNGLVDYDPAELVLTAQAGTPLADIETALSAQGQMLAFEPPDWRELLHTEAAATLGGTLACNMAGPRRVRAGAARDHFLGFSAVNGQGEIWKAGGRVVKNVTGYDLCKLHAGAFGTLSVLLEVSVRVLPQPPTSCSVVFSGLAEPDAIRLLAAALNTPHEVSGAAHLPATAAARSGLAHLLPAGEAVSVLRVEGPEPSVLYRASALEGLQARHLRLDAAQSASLWAEIGGVAPLLAAGNTMVWRVCTTPSAAPALLHSVRGQIAGADGFYDWGGGLLWIEIDPDSCDDAGTAVIRNATEMSGGHATLVRAPDPIRARHAVFQPLPGPLAALSRRVKAGFDPLGILNPGRMQRGI